MKKIKISFVLVALFFSIFAINNKINASDGNFNNDTVVQSTQSKSRAAVNSSNYTKLKANNGYKYKLFHDYYVEELSKSKKVNVYFNLSKVSDKKVKKAMKKVISSFSGVSKKQIRLYTSKPKGNNYFEVKVRDYKNGAQCYTDSAYVLACAGSDSLDILKNITKYHYSSNDYTAILMHEFLHIFGISHTSSKSKGTIMRASYKKISKFNIKKYYNDVSAWKTLNSPYRTTTKVTKSSKKSTKRFLNTYLYSYKTYTKNKKYVSKYVYYGNGKRSKVINYQGTKSNPKKSVYNYNSNGVYLKNSYFYERNGKTLSKKNEYNNTRYNNVVKQWLYKSGKVYRATKFNKNSNSRTYYKEWDVLYKNGIRSVVIYYKLEKNSPVLKRIYYGTDGVQVIRIEDLSNVNSSTKVEKSNKVEQPEQEDKSSQSEEVDQNKDQDKNDKPAQNDNSSQSNESNQTSVNAE